MTVTIMKKTKNLKTRAGIFKSVGGNIPGGNFQGGSLMGGNFPDGKYRMKLRYWSFNWSLAECSKVFPESLVFQLFVPLLSEPAKQHKDIKRGTEVAIGGLIKQKGNKLWHWNFVCDLYKYSE